MKRWLLCIFVFAIGLQGCKIKDKERTNSDVLKVTCTTGMIADACAVLGGPNVDVIALMGPGVDPHLYKASQGDLRKLSKAELVLYNGLHLEGKMQEILEKFSLKKAVVAISSSIPQEKIRKSIQYKDAPDPHIWFDVKLWQYAVKDVSAALISQLPHHKDSIEYRTEAYLQELSSLDAWTQETLQEIPERQRVLITAHDAFGYLGGAYGIEVKGLQGLSTLSEPGLRDITELVDFVIDRNIGALFVESSVSAKAINAVVEGCQKKGHQVEIGGELFSDAMGPAGTPEGTYLGMVKHNIHTIHDALKR